MSEWREKKGWTTVRVGPTVVGAVGPTVANPRLVGCQPSITIVAGETEYRLNAKDFQREVLGQVDSGQYLNKVEDELGFLVNMFNYRKEFAVPVPADSLDVTSSGEIDYTARSGETLIAALMNFFNALVLEIQANLHTLTPVEVVRKFAELISCNYLSALRNNLKWRGIPLNDILTQRTTMKVTVIRESFFSPSYDGFFELQHLPASRAYGSLGAAGFDAFVDWQRRSAIKSTRVFPENVIHVRASSLEDYELAEKLFTNDKFLKRYFSRKSSGPMDATFFLSMAGDPLEKWLDGETISMDEFLGTTAEDGLQRV